MQTQVINTGGTECETGPGYGISNWGGEISQQLDILIKTPSLTQWLKLVGAGPWKWAQPTALCSHGSGQEGQEEREEMSTSSHAMSITPALLHKLVPNDSVGRVSSLVSSARAVPALTRNLGLKDASRAPRRWSHAWVKHSCSEELSPSHTQPGCPTQGISQSMPKHRQKPPRQQLGGICWEAQKVLTWLGHCHQF